MTEDRRSGSAPDPTAKTNPRINRDSVPTKQTHDDAEQANSVDASTPSDDSKREVFEDDGSIVELPDSSRGTPRPEN